MLVDNETKYVYNILPYLGAIEKETRNGKTLAEDVVQRLTGGLQNKGQLLYLTKSRNHAE